MPVSEQPRQNSPGDELVLKRLQGYKSMLKNMQEILSNVDIEHFNYKVIDQFRTDLTNFLKFIDSLKDDPKISKYVRSIRALSINIRDVMTELAVSRHLLHAINERDIKMAEIADGVRQFHKSLIICQDYLEEAQNQIRI